MPSTTAPGLIRGSPAAKGGKIRRVSSITAAKYGILWREASSICETLEKDLLISSLSLPSFSGFWRRKYVTVVKNVAMGLDAAMMIAIVCARTNSSDRIDDLLDERVSTKTLPRLALLWSFKRFRRRSLRSSRKSMKFLVNP